MSYQRKNAIPNLGTNSYINSADNGHKFSLRNRSFKAQIVDVDTMRKQQAKEPFAMDLAEFLEKHNTQLKARKTSKPSQQSQSIEFFNCFERNHFQLSSSNNFLKAFVSHRETNSTLSSSENSMANSRNGRGVAVAQGIDSGSVSMVRELARYEKSQLLNQRSMSKKEFKQGSHAKHYRAGSSDGVSDFRKNSNRSNFQGKFSLRDRKIINQVELPYENTGFSYKQLSQTVNLAKSFGRSIRVSVSTIDDPSISERQAHPEKQKPKDQNTQFGCSCFSKCKLAHKWLKMVQQSKISYESTLYIENNRKNLSSKNNQKDIKAELNKQILRQFCLKRPETGYIEGMEKIVSAIISHTADKGEASSIFSFIMIDRNFEALYKGDFAVSYRLAQHLEDQLERYAPDLSQLLVTSSVKLSAAVRTWYFSMLGVVIPPESMGLVIDKFLRKGLKGLNEILLAFLIYLKEQLVEADYSSLSSFFSLSRIIPRSCRIDWPQLIACSHNLMLRQILF